MRRLCGQAARGLAALLHLLAHAALGIAVLLLAFLSIAAWRLSQGPVDLSWLTARLEAAANAEPGNLHVSVGSSALAWEGFRHGVDQPLDLRLSNLQISDRGGRQHVDIPKAEVTISLFALLLGRLQAHSISFEHPRLTLRRADDGMVSLDLGAGGGGAGLASPTGDFDAPLPDLLAVLARPAARNQGAAPGWLTQLRRVTITDADITVLDAQLGAVWRAPHAEIRLERRPAGGLDGTADLALALGDQHAQLSLKAALAPGATETRLQAHLSPVQPAALARASPALARLAVLDAPVATDAALVLGPALELKQFSFAAKIGAGYVQLGDSNRSIVNAVLRFAGTPEVGRIEAAELTLRGHPDAPTTTVSVSGTWHRTGEAIEEDLVLDLDQLDFADLPELWPAGIGGPGARPWVTGNITAGTARQGHVTVALSHKDDFSDLKLTRASGTLEGTGLTVHWLRPLPPIVDGRGQLRILDPDTLEIAVQSGREVLRNGAVLMLTGGTMRIGGLMQPEQPGEIRAEISGALPAAIALLREPRLHLFDRAKLPLTDPAGDFTASLSVSLPLREDVRIENIRVRAAAHLQRVHLGNVLGAHALDQGTLDLTAENDGMTLKGQATLAAIPVSLDAAMDFRAGPPQQPRQRVSVSGQADSAKLAGLGVDLTDMVSGPIGLQAVLTEQRNGTGTVAIDADLKAARLHVDQLDWSKPPGKAATASARLMLVQNRLDAVEGIALRGDGLTFQGAATCADGHVRSVRLDRLVLDRTELRGEVLLPSTPGGAPLAVSVIGPVLDLSARLGRPASPPHAPAGEPPPGPPWSLEARFERVLLANGVETTAVHVHAENDGRVYQRLAVEGALRDHTAFALHVAPKDGVRQLALSAGNVGELLRGLDVNKTVQNGKLTIEGRYDDHAAGQPLTGTAELSDFSVRQAATLGKLLQAMTLYGLFDALSGPGLAFRQLVAPFRYTEDALELHDVRAFSPSLGLTAKGKVDLAWRRIDIAGTIVPAYFFNSLLGHVPLIGRLFSPERGGGVFAASYGLHGSLDDPDVAVNPLAALTPGFLRGLFGIF